MKRCSTCKTEHEETAFGRDKRSSDGLTSECKNAANARKRKRWKSDPAWRAKRIADRKADRDRDRERYKTDHLYREQKLAKNRAHRMATTMTPKAVAKRARYIADKTFRETAMSYAKAWSKRFRERKRCHHAVAAAIRNGSLVRPSACAACATVGRVNAHHHDYTKPLDVHWLCQRCHALEHQ